MLEAIFGLIGVVVGALLTLGYNYWRDRQEREEKYRVLLYPKRLEVHQKAFYYNQKLYSVLNKARPKDEVLEAYDEAVEWWNSECFYLDKTSRKETLAAINSLITYALPDLKPELFEPTRERLNKALEAVEKGIKMRHLDRLKESEQLERK